MKLPVVKHQLYTYLQLHHMDTNLAAQETTPLSAKMQHYRDLTISSKIYKSNVLHHAVPQNPVVVMAHEKNLLLLYRSRSPQAGVTWSCHIGYKSASKLRPNGTKRECPVICPYIRDALVKIEPKVFFIFIFFALRWTSRAV